MGLINWLFGKKEIEDTSGPQNTTVVAENVTTHKALQTSAVFGCTKLLTDTISTLPLNVYEYSNGIKQKAKKHSLYNVLHRSPNSYQTTAEYLQTVMSNLVLSGNSYSIINRRTDGSVISLIPLNSRQMEVISQNGVLTYVYSKDNKETTFQQSDILHIKQLSMNGVVGIDVLSAMAQTVGVALSNNKLTKKSMDSGGQPSAILKVPNKLSEEQRKVVKENFFGKNGEVQNNRPLLLEFGMEFTPISLSPEALQMLETKRFSIEDICRFFGVPSILIGENSSSTQLGSSTSEIILAFYKTTIKPLLVIIEQAMEKQLLTNQDKRNGTSIEFNFEGLLRASTTERAQFYKELSQIGAMTINDIRQKENLPKINGGDEPLVALNMIKLTELDNYHSNKTTTTKDS